MINYHIHYSFQKFEGPKSYRASSITHILYFFPSCRPRHVRAQDMSEPRVVTWMCSFVHPHKRSVPFLYHISIVVVLWLSPAAWLYSYPCTRCSSFHKFLWLQFQMARFVSVTPFTLATCALPSFSSYPWLFITLAASLVVNPLFFSCHKLTYPNSHWTLSWYSRKAHE